jgi:Family of unknown function (DUF5675)
MRWICMLLGLLISPATLAAEDLAITIQRNLSCAGGETGGTLSINGQVVARTLELPWRNNENNISRIPAGTYPATIRQDGNLGWRIELNETSPREGLINLHQR